MFLKKNEKIIFLDDDNKTSNFQLGLKNYDFCKNQGGFWSVIPILIGFKLSKDNQINSQYNLLDFKTKSAKKIIGERFA